MSPSCVYFPGSWAKWMAATKQVINNSWWQTDRHWHHFKRKRINSDDRLRIEPKVVSFWQENPIICYFCILMLNFNKCQKWVHDQCPPIWILSYPVGGKGFQTTFTDSNLDHQSRRQVHWPLNHHDPYTKRIVTFISKYGDSMQGFLSRGCAYLDECLRSNNCLSSSFCNE